MNDGNENACVLTMNAGGKEVSAGKLGDEMAFPHAERKKRTMDSGAPCMLIPYQKNGIETTSTTRKRHQPFQTTGFIKAKIQDVAEKSRDSRIQALGYWPTGKNRKVFNGQQSRFHHQRGFGIRTKQPWKKKEEPITKKGWIWRNPGKDSPAKRRTRIP